MKKHCLAAALFLLTGDTTLAEDTPMEAKFRLYHEAINSVERCRNTTFTEAQHVAMGEEINILIEGRIGAGRRLTIVEEAKRRMHDVIFRGRCEDPQVVERLALFDADLAPALARLESN